MSKGAIHFPTGILNGEFFLLIKLNEITFYYAAQPNASFWSVSYSVKSKYLINNRKPQVEMLFFAINSNLI